MQDRRFSIAKRALTVLLYFMLSLTLVFTFTNFSSLNNILHDRPEKIYTADQMGLERWTAMEDENTFCSDDDPIIVFSGYNGYVHSVVLNITTLEDTPDCSPKLYWTDAEHPNFSEECSQELLTKKTEDGYLVTIKRNVTDLRLDLYNNAGAKIKIENIIINPRTIVFPEELIPPICILGCLYIIYQICAQKSRRKNQDYTPAKKKVEELDFVRAVCAVGIILFHVSSYISPDAPKFLYTYANGRFGAMLVGVFFIISGGVLYHNYRETGNLAVFYYKRWKSIFPMFYITFLFFFIRNAVMQNTFFYNGKPWRLLLSVFGMDGYFYYRFPGYYIVGEWFLGAIVFLYVLYPIFAKLINCMGWKILFFVVPMIIWQFETDWFAINAMTNLIYCSAMFIVGMLIFKYNLYWNRIIKLVGCISSAVVLFVPLPGIGLYGSMVSYVLMFFALFTIGGFVIQVPALKCVFTFLSGLSFPMFLVQNKVIGFLTTYIPVNTYVDLFKVMVMAVCLSIFYAWCIRAVVQEIMKTKWFVKLDKAFMSLNNKGD